MCRSEKVFVEIGMHCFMHSLYIYSHELLGHLHYCIVCQYNAFNVYSCENIYILPYDSTLYPSRNQDEPLSEIESIQ